MAEEINLEWLKQHFFNDPTRTITIRAGETLMEQHQFNDRLYLILEGSLQGFLPDADLQDYPIFESGKDKFIGVFSFFSEDHLSYSKIIAKEDSRLCYIEYAQDDEENITLEDFRRQVRFFVSVILNELQERQQFARRMANHRREDLRKLMHAEKMATLGQMAAGLAHELNNAVGVIRNNTRWLKDVMSDYLKDKDTHNMYRFYELGLEHGQSLSTADARKARKDLERQLKLEPGEIRKLANTGIEAKTIKPYLSQIDNAPERIMYYWDIGTNFHDLLQAARHARHVVGSVKQLGVAQHEWSEDLNVVYTIQEALTILKAILANVEVGLDLPDHLPTTSGSPGELTQVWINLIKNGVEAVLGSQNEQPTLNVTAKEIDKMIQVTITDNGPGIPKEIREKIFEPSFTTKVGGQSVGMGLGLTIVARIIEDHRGTITAESGPGKTVFTVNLPIT